MIGTTIAPVGVVSSREGSKQENIASSENPSGGTIPMLTITCEPKTTDHTVTQNETPLSDLEISRRVLQIRSNWSISERLRRRREAEQRFADLMDKLGSEAA